MGTNSEVDYDIVSDFGHITATGREVNWHNIKLDSVLFITLTTHELQRTGSDEVIAPFTKINDGKMYILGFKETSKFEALKLFTKIDKNATHVDLNAFFNFPLTQINFEPSNSWLLMVHRQWHRVQHRWRDLRQWCDHSHSPPRLYQLLRQRRRLSNSLWIQLRLFRLFWIFT